MWIIERIEKEWKVRWNRIVLWICMCIYVVWVQLLYCIQIIYNSNSSNYMMKKWLFCFELAYRLSFESEVVMINPHCSGSEKNWWLYIGNSLAASEYQQLLAFVSYFVFLCLGTTCGVIEFKDIVFFSPF